MSCRRTLAMGLATLAFGLIAAERVNAQGFGVSTRPSTFMQCMGYGFGAGPHAPIVRTPRQEPPHTQRMMFAPPCRGPLQPAPYVIMRCTGGCETGNCGCGNLGYPQPAGELIAPPAPTPADETAMRNYRVATQYRWP